MAGVGELVRAGGPVMVGLLACSFVALTVVFDRLLFWWRLERRRDRRRVDAVLETCQHGRWQEALEVAAGCEDFVVRVLACGIVHRQFSLTAALEAAAAQEVKRMQRHMAVLDTLITVAPLLGILGTVTGIIASFDVLGQHGVAQPQAVAAGIGQALVTTAAGLVVAIGSLVPYNLFHSRIEAAMHTMEKYGASLEILWRKQTGNGETAGKGHAVGA